MNKHRLRTGDIIISSSKIAKDFTFHIFKVDNEIRGNWHKKGKPDPDYMNFSYRLDYFDDLNDLVVKRSCTTHLPDFL